MAKTLGTIFVILVLLVCAGDLRVFSGPQPHSAQDIELADGWRLASARGLPDGGAVISANDYDAAAWHPVRRMPATVLETLQDDGVYPNLYYGKNLLEEVPQDLYKQDWWYRTTFTAPSDHPTYLLDFPGINYRAEIWLNGHRVAGNEQIVGMYTDHELDVTRWITPGGPNTLAVKVTPEQAVQDVDGVELADSWYDWINWRYLGYQGPDKNPANGNSFVPDRNAGIWKPVYLKTSGPVSIGDATVNTELPLPDTDSARLTVYAPLRNYSIRQVRGVLRATITRNGRAPIHVDEPVALLAGEEREITLSPDRFAALVVDHPDLWWPYTMGRPDLYDLRLEFVQNDAGKEVVTEVSTLKFGIRTITQGRDSDDSFADLGTGGNFYLQVNGKNFLIRGATYTPDLLYKYDPDRDAAILRYVKDLGLNMLRLESKISSRRFVEMADELGIPLMYGWMCCNQWEKWQQWDDEDYRVAQESLRSQITMLRPHASVFVWANGSDGRPPAGVLTDYHQILSDLHWQNATVDTVSSLNRDADGQQLWDGIQMAGPYTWRPPSYWFAGQYGAARGSSAEQGDNEHIPPFASLQKFIPPDKLWPINDTWFFHAGSDPQNSRLVNVQRVIDRRYGPSTSAKMFADKAQLAHYEATRAQFESFAANGWDGHKMTIYWMLNSHWPSFFGNIFDYYLRPGGAYYGAKKGLQPLSVVFDSYATGNHRQAHVTVVNQTPGSRENLRVRVRTYDVKGALRDDRAADGISVDPGGAVQAMTLPPGPSDSPVFFVRCELLDPAGDVIADNVYWQSRRVDDVGPPANDAAFNANQVSWADMTALNSMPKVPLDITAAAGRDGGRDVTISLHNPTSHIAFFERAELLPSALADEILPIEYDDNYVTVFPGETVSITGRAPDSEPAPAWVRVTGYNGTSVVVQIH
ncbi:glycoside hydrolase [Mycobacterium sp. CVI_P3]|uniref:Glycoside hydrolase n=1 Tax=Mycobacterium pinniadriaticum TaxID=2994102 RepID=A0ABT3S9Z3_9MYCO|nr:sugar-binding domain-containing protein [Mycobacterium pinniadriaticum]MCX2929555.1 glycoside hydrolase [Mycobacterium pinniadriaticum]MCX2935979.1 glycoside hydrolase [Mycobacterium pinniadriaticum]